ncbi:amino acid adenylation domain-containing protein [Chitinophaga pinensis]|uniref:Amino acid adenylation domain-containing protein n=1 Tax=Chitinophaga pinensis TaxID=79329 RepID=A0A5C6LR39_9BACT|nr:amino acid adenylation domain-containing protein [Chitinophaga pinensis]
MYGPTETTVWLTEEDHIDDEIITVGRPIGNMFAYIWIISSGKYRTVPWEKSLSVEWESG